MKLSKVHMIGKRMNIYAIYNIVLMYLRNQENKYTEHAALFCLIRLSLYAEAWFLILSCRTWKYRLTCLQSHASLSLLAWFFQITLISFLKKSWKLYPGVLQWIYNTVTRCNSVYVSISKSFIFLSSPWGSLMLITIYIYQTHLQGKFINYLFSLSSRFFSLWRLMPLKIFLSLFKKLQESSNQR